MYTNAVELIQLTEANNSSISEEALNRECKLTEKPSESVINGVRIVLQIMLESSKNALDKEIRSVSGLTGGSAKKVEDYRKKGITDLGMEGQMVISPGNWSSKVCKFFQIGSIPRYMIMNKKGDIVDFNAKRPVDPSLGGQLRDELGK